MSIEKALSIIPAVGAQVIGVLGVYTIDYIPVFVGAATIKAEIKEESKIFEHPVESGAVIADHIIYNPTDITLYVIFKPGLVQVTYQFIKQLYEQVTPLIIQTKLDTYKDYVLSSIPHVEEPDYNNTATMVIKLHQVQTVTASFEPAPKNPQNTSTVNRGTVNGIEAAPEVTRKSSLLYQGFF